MIIPLIVILAIAQVETGGDNRAHNIKENARGALQITPVVIEDVNRILGRNEYTHEDAHDFSKASAILRIYLGHYATRERLGREPRPSDFARIWNGGPNGLKKVETVDYARRFNAILAELCKG